MSSSGTGGARRDAPAQNALLESFYRHQQGRVPHGQNRLLSDFTYERGVGQEDQARKAMLARVFEGMSRLERLQRIKAQGRYNEIANTDDMRDRVLRPERTVLSAKNSERLSASYLALEDAYKDDESFKRGAAEHWSRRTNQPYKNIIKDERYYKAFLTEEKRKGLSSQDELIVHRVTELDRDAKRLEREFLKKSEEISNHNEELTLVYSASKREENRCKFEYNHVYKFGDRYNPAAHEEMKRSRTAAYGLERELAEGRGALVASVMESLDGPHKGGTAEGAASGCESIERANTADFSTEAGEESDRSSSEDDSWDASKRVSVRTGGKGRGRLVPAND